MDQQVYVRLTREDDHKLVSSKKWVSIVRQCERRYSYNAWRPNDRNFISKHPVKFLKDLSIAFDSIYIDRVNKVGDYTAPVSGREKMEESRPVRDIDRGSNIYSRYSMAGVVFP